MALITHLEPEQSNYSSSSVDELSSTIEDLRILMEELLGVNGPAWAPLISQWSLSLLGELSSRHSALIIKARNTLSNTIIIIKVDPRVIFLLF